MTAKLKSNRDTVWAMRPGHETPEELLVLQRFESGLIKTRSPMPQHRIVPVWIEESWIVPNPKRKPETKTIACRIEEVLVKYPRNRMFTAGQLARLTNISALNVKRVMPSLIRKKIVELIRTTIVGRIKQPPDKYRLSPCRKRKRKRKRDYGMNKIKRGRGRGRKIKIKRHIQRKLRRDIGMRRGWRSYDRA